MNKKIVVFAANKCSKEKEKHYYSLAYQMGKLLAKEGFTVVTGGGPGLMDQVSKGAYEAGGKTIGYCLDMPGRKNSRYLTEKHLYQQLNKRQETLIHSADGIISLPGGVGTLYEVFAVLSLKRKGEMDKKIPLILVDSIYQNLEKLLDGLVIDGLMDKEVKSYYKLVESAEEAVDKLKIFFQAR